jgi:hypothetical protein
MSLPEKGGPAMMGQAQRDSRSGYPKFSNTLTEGDLRFVLFTVTPEEEQWAQWVTTIARRAPSMVALLMYLKAFQHVGRFLQVAEIPSATISRVAERLYQAVPAALSYIRRILHRQHRAIRRYLAITSCAAKARRVGGHRRFIRASVADL